MKKLDSFSARFAAWLVVSVLAALPLILVWIYGAETITSGSESLAYRFFYSYRVLNGEGGYLWFLQGYLVSLFQSILMVVTGIDSARGGDLREAFNLFCRGTMAFNTVLLIGGAAMVSFIRGVRWTDRLLYAIVALAPIFATTGQGFQHSIWPDLGRPLAVVFAWDFSQGWRWPTKLPPGSVGRPCCCWWFSGRGRASVR